MARSDGAVRYVISGDNSEFRSDVQQTQQIAEKAAADIGKAFKVAIAAGTAAFSAAVTMGVKYNANVEQITSTFSGLLQSEEKAATLMRQLTDYAQATSFDIDGLAKSTQKLLAYGVDEDKLLDTVKQLGDISMGSSEKMEYLALALGQVNGKGHLMTQELRQMQEQGFNPLDFIIEKTGESMSELTKRIEQGGVSYDEVAEAVQRATSAGHKYYNMTGLQANTLIGKWNELKEKTSETFGKMTTEVNDALKNKILPALTKFVEKIDVKKIVDGIKSLINVAKMAAPAVLAVATAIGTFKTALAISSAISQTVEKLNKLSAAFSSTSGLISSLSGAKTAVTGFFSSLMAANPVLATTAAVAGCAAALAALIGILYVAIANTETYTEEQREELSALQAKREELEKNRDAYAELEAARAESINAGLSEMAYIETLSAELDRLVDANGRVDEANKGRVQFILNELNSALGTEFTMTGNLVNQYGSLKTAIEEAITAKKNQIFLDAMEPAYREAVLGIAQAERDRNAAYLELKKTQDEYNAVHAKTIELSNEYKRVASDETLTQDEKIKKLNELTASSAELLTQEGYLKDKMDELSTSYETASNSVDTYTKDIAAYEAAQEIALTGTSKFGDTVQEVYEKLGGASSGMVTATSQSHEALLESLWETVQNAQRNVDEYAEKLGKLPGYTEEGLEAAKEKLKEAQQEFTDAGGNLAAGVEKGFAAKAAGLVSTARATMAGAIKAMKAQAQINSPSKATEWQGEMLAEGLARGMKDGAKTPVKEARALSSTVTRAIGVENNISNGFAAAASSGDRPINAKFNLTGNVEMDGYRVGKVVLENLDDLASTIVRGVHG